MTNQLLNYICLTNLRLKHYFKFFRHPNKKALNLQLKRTLVKKDTQNVGIINLIDKLTQYKKFNKNQRVLFVGCRNDFELNYFKKSILFAIYSHIWVDLYHVPIKYIPEEYTLSLVRDFLPVARQLEKENLFSTQNF